MNIVKFVFNPIQENTYLLWDQTMECIIMMQAILRLVRIAVWQILLQITDLNP